MSENKMINLNNVSEEARGILVEAIPYNHLINSTDREIYELYEKFQKATGRKYVGDGSFKRFQGAVLGMKRKLKTLTYKDGNLDGIMLKGLVL